MLRCINPQEAKLLDAASGIHIKFRLAGVGTHVLDDIRIFCLPYIIREVKQKGKLNSF